MDPIAREKIISLPTYNEDIPTDPLRSIVPMFGGPTKYVETLDPILEFVETHHPTTDELIGWHRSTFAKVSSSDSIMRRVNYLQQVASASMVLNRTDHPNFEVRPYAKLKSTFCPIPTKWQQTMSSLMKSIKLKSKNVM